MKKLAAIAFLAMVTGACSVTGDGNSPTEPPDGSPTSTSGTYGTNGTSDPEEPATSATPEKIELVAPPAGVPAIEVLGPANGEGTRPLLRWSPLQNAVSYSVVVYDPEGEAYWATVTSATETFVGGPEQLLEDRPGPRIASGSTWSVVALDDQANPIAFSGYAIIHP